MSQQATPAVNLFKFSQSLWLHQWLVPLLRGSSTQRFLRLGAPLLGDDIFVSANSFFGSADSIFGFIRGANGLFVSADGGADGSADGSADGFFCGADCFFVSTDGYISGWWWS